MSLLPALPVIADDEPEDAVVEKAEGFENLADAAAGKNVLMYPEYIDGGEGFNEREGSASLFVYDEDSTTFPKYCTDKLPYWAEWKYDEGFTVDRIILRTGGDSKKSPRRMGDGWTLSGSNDGESWEVIYTGFEEDVQNEDDMYYRIDLPDNNEKYQYYRLYSEDAGSAEGQDRNLIQYSMLILCGNKIGSPIGDVLYSDITAYINGYEIPTSIIAGKTLVVVEDLAKYGFNVVWDGAERTLSAELNMKKAFKPIEIIKEDADGHKPGDFKQKYLFTDIKTYVAGKLVTSYAINGVTLIDFNELEQFGAFKWDAAERTISLTIEPLPVEMPVVEPVVPDPSVPEVEAPEVPEVAPAVEPAAEPAAAVEAAAEPAK